MASFANLRANMNLNIQNFASSLRRASTLTSSFASSLHAQLNGGIVQPAKEAKFEFKDVARIVQGIIISKVFYSGLNAIRNCIDAVWDFSTSLEYAQIAYSNLFNDSELAKEFINVLKDFSAVTPFSFSDSEAAAKRLLAYGVEYKNVMYMMQGIMSASSAQNNPYVIESVSRAMGQIYTKGRLMNEEMRQLAEAGIPAYAILKEELGLTQKQLQHLGNESIAASTAINALIEGMNKRYGGVVAASSKTMQGLLSNIKDNLLMVGSGVLEPIYARIKSLVNKFGEFIAKIRNIYELRGIGGIFNELIPEKLQAQLKAFIANLMNIWVVAKVMLKSAFEALRNITYSLMTALNVILPILTAATDVLARLCLYITTNEKAMRRFTKILAAAAAMWVLFKVRALAAMVVTAAINLMSKALAGLATALTFIVGHPIWTTLILAVGIVTALSGAFDELGQKIRNAFYELTRLNGYDPNELFLESQKKRANDIEKFNQALDGTADAMEDVGDATEDAANKAKKAQKDLLSFDEVFRLKQPDEGTDNGIDTDDLLDIGDLGDITDIETEDIMPEIPDFNDYVADFVDNFLETFKKHLATIKEKILSTGIGAIIGAALGGILGGPLGAKLGAVAGAIVGWFWEDIKKAFSISDPGDLATPIGAMLGLAIGKLVGHPIIGAAIGALVGWTVDSIIDAIQTGDWSKVGLPIGTSLGAAIGALVGHPIIGASIGALVGWIYNSIAEGIKTGDWSSACISIGTGLGAAIGAIVGHPILGAAIGTFAGWLVDTLWDTLKKHFGVIDAQGIATAINTALSAVLSGVASFISTRLIPVFLGDSFAGFATNCSVSIKQALTTGLKSGILGAIASLGAGLLTNALTGWIAKELDMTESDLSNSSVGQSIGGLIGSIAGLIISAGNPLGAVIGNTIGQLVGGVLGLFWEDIVEWGKRVVDSISTFIDNIGPRLQTFIADVASFIDALPYNLGHTLGQALGQALAGIVTFITDCSSAVVNFFTVTLPNAVSTAVNAISSFFTVTLPNVLSNFAGVLVGVAQTIQNFFTVTLPSVLSAAAGAVANFFTVTIPNAISTAVSAIGNFFTVTIPNALNGLVNLLSTAAQAVQNFFLTTIPNLFKSITGFLRNAAGAISRFITTTLPSLLTAAGNAIAKFCTITIPNAIKTAVGAIGNFFTTILPNAFNNLIQSIANIGPAIANFFSNLGSTFLSWGSYIVQGLITGFKNAFPMVWEAITEFCQGFIDGFCMAFGIQSPATTMMPIGQYILLGIVEGMYQVLEQVLVIISEIGLQIIEAITGWFTEIGLTISTWALETSDTITNWYLTTSELISTWISEKVSQFSTWSSSAKSSVNTWASNTLSAIINWVTSTSGKITTWASTVSNKFSGVTSTVTQKIASFVSGVISRFSNMISNTLSQVGAWASGMVSNASIAMSNLVSNISAGLNNALAAIANFCANALARIQSWAAAFGSWISSTISSAASAINSFVSGISSRVGIRDTTKHRAGHATGGVFNREHVARFAEGNKAEAIIPLENKAAMQPFVDAVADGLAQSFGPILANMHNISNTVPSTQLQPLYVGTLIADERGLKELNRKMQVIQLKEEKRRG